MEVLNEINLQLLLPIFFLQAVLLIIALWDIIRNKHLNGPKWLWILVIVLGSILGPILYFVFGRSKNR